MSRAGYSLSKRQRAQRKAEKKREKQARRQRKRELGADEPEIVTAAEVVGDLPSIEEAMQNLPVSDPNAEVDRSARTIPVRLFVGRLSWDTTVRSLRKRFERFGKVLDAVVAQDRDTGRSRGFGFVEMADRRDAPDVISALDGSELDGREIVVNLATERGRRAPDHGRYAAHHGGRYSHAQAG